MILSTILTPALFLLLAQPQTVMEQVAPAASLNDATSSSQDDLQERASVEGRLPANQQIAKDKDGRPRIPQLTAEPGGGKIDQLGPLDRGTQSTPDLSDRRQGFETRVIRLEGTDKCSADLLSDKDREYCQQVIENRAAEYAGPEENRLSLEQELLSRRNLRQLEGNTNGAINRLAAGQSSSNDPEDQAIASIVLGTQSEGASEPSQTPAAESNLSAETQALLEAIVNNINGTPRN